MLHFNIHTIFGGIQNGGLLRVAYFKLAAFAEFGFLNNPLLLTLAFIYFRYMLHLLAWFVRCKSFSAVCTVEKECLKISQ
jgi:hypothetical protein